MTTTHRINHTGHAHPNTPTARAACRKAGGVQVAGGPSSYIAEHIRKIQVTTELHDAMKRRYDEQEGTKMGITLITAHGNIRRGDRVEVTFIGDAASQVVTVTGWGLGWEGKNGRDVLDVIDASGANRWVYVDDITRKV